MTEEIVIRSRRQPYVVLGAIFAPVVAFPLYLAIRDKAASLFQVDALMGVLVAFVFWHLSRFKLTLTKDSVVFRELWRSTETPIKMIHTVDPGHLFGVSPTWVIHRRDRVDTTLIKIANFMPADLRRFADALIERDPAIRFNALPHVKGR